MVRSGISECHAVLENTSCGVRNGRALCGRWLISSTARYSRSGTTSNSLGLAGIPIQKAAGVVFEATSGGAVGTVEVDVGGIAASNHIKVSGELHAVVEGGDEDQRQLAAWPTSNAVSCATGCTTKYLDTRSMSVTDAPRVDLADESVTFPVPDALSGLGNHGTLGDVPPLRHAAAIGGDSRPLAALVAAPGPTCESARRGLIAS